MGMTRVALLGSTGSIGRQTLSVVAAHPDRLQIVGLAAGQNLDLLARQVVQFQPRLVAVRGPEPPVLPAMPGTEVLTGSEGLVALATMTEADVVVVATSGHAAILPTLRAIEVGKTIALANKEAIVCAGELIVPAARRAGVPIYPVDSEHSAIWQCLSDAPAREVRQVTLTASGGPFLETPLAALNRVTIEQALAHPNWKMGSKVTIDSATMMNKGLEVIEAHWLFDLPYDKIGVVIHPQSIVHSLVSFVDGVVMAQLALPDMRVPIQYALSYPARWPSIAKRLEIHELGRLDFLPPDLARFPALDMARQAGERGGSYPTVLSGADEVAVEAFLAGRIRFTEIAAVVRETCERHQPAAAPLTLEAIAEADAWAHRVASELVAARTAP
jgi:1-deoxy-D-xylulose-5-phosphate reductoisomerase